MRIAIDMRMAGTGEGIARYVEELVKHLADLDFANDYFLLFNKQSANSKFKIQNSKFRSVFVNSDYYSFAEQTRFIWEIKKLRPDLVHFASFNAPILYPGKFIVTIHDIIHHLYPGKKKSRILHRMAYRMAISQTIRRARKIIAISQATKTEIKKTFKTSDKKISVIYEGVNSEFFFKMPEGDISSIKSKYGISKPYILFVGVWRQYKNLPRLSRAFDILKEKHGIDCQLVLAGKVDPFYPEIFKQVMLARNSRDIKVTGFIPDSELRALYQGASLFVTPSLVEGFGLIGIEAQASGIPVVASDISVLREVLGDSSLYFNPEDEQDIARVAAVVLSDQRISSQLREKGSLNVQRFKWGNTARATLEIYQQAGMRKL